MGSWKLVLPISKTAAADSRMIDLCPLLLRHNLCCLFHACRTPWMRRSGCGAVWFVALPWSRSSYVRSGLTATAPFNGVVQRIREGHALQFQYKPRLTRHETWAPQGSCSLDLQLTPTPTNQRRRSSEAVSARTRPGRPRNTEPQTELPRWKQAMFRIISTYSYMGWEQRRLRTACPPGAIPPLRWCPFCNLPRGQVFTRVCSSAASPNTAKKYTTCTSAEIDRGLYEISIGFAHGTVIYSYGFYLSIRCSVSSDMGEVMHVKIAKSHFQVL
jgi:hypothetical protein